MLSEHSVTRLIAGLKGGDEESARLLWERFFGQLTRIANRKLGSVPRRVQDEEDLALSAMNALCTGAREGRFRQLESRDDFWQILVMITARKASNVRRKQATRRERGDSALHVIVGRDARDVSGARDGSDDGDDGVRVAELLESAPTESLVDSLGICCEEMLDVLEEKLQQVALLKLAGHTNQEIADIRERSVKTIERYLKMIRRDWTRFVQTDCQIPTKTS